MSVYNPNAWIMLKISRDGKSHYRVFAGWYGGFTSGDSWKISSGVESIKYDSRLRQYEIKNASGSLYVCRQDNEHGLTMYMQSVLAHTIQQSAEAGGVVEEAEDWKQHFGV